MRSVRSSELAIPEGKKRGNKRQEWGLSNEILKEATGMESVSYLTNKDELRPLHSRPLK